jgi:uncharacterized protein with NRDE domain
MCLLVWNWQPASAAPLLLLSNRDEFYRRPTQSLHWWNNSSSGVQILAGKDLQAGGTWLGVSRSGRLAAITNFRNGQAARLNTPSRGELVAAFLHGEMGALQYVQLLAGEVETYNPFNLLVFDGQQLMGLESRSARVLEIPAGLGGVSNAGFNTPWPKLTRLKEALQIQLLSGNTGNDALLQLLQDTRTAPDEALPQTGVSLELERALSSIFVASSDYGTRACSVVQLSPTHVNFVEHSFSGQGPTGTVCEKFNVLPATRS